MAAATASATAASAAASLAPLAMALAAVVSASSLMPCRASIFAPIVAQLVRANEAFMKKASRMKQPDELGALMAAAGHALSAGESAAIAGDLLRDVLKEQRRTNELLHKMLPPGSEPKPPPPFV